MTKLTQVLYLTLILSLLPALANAQAVCPKTGYPAELEQCLNIKLEQAVNDLTTSLDSIQSRFRDNPVFIAALRQSQQQWDLYRKQECGTVYQLWLGKPDQQLMTVSCSVNLARTRISFLQRTYLPN